MIMRKNNYKQIQWAAGWPPKRHILIPGTYECYLIQKEGLYNCDLKVRTLRGRVYPGLSKWPLSAITCILIREREIRLKNTGERDTQREGVSVTVECCSHKPRNGCRHQKLEEARYTFSPRTLGKNNSEIKETLILDFWTTELWENKFLSF